MLLLLIQKKIMPSDNINAIHHIIWLLYESSVPCIVNYHRLPGQKWLYRMSLPIVQLHWGWNIFEEGILNLNWNKFPAKSRPMCNDIILNILNHKIMKISTCFSFWDVHAGVSVWKRGWIGERCFACKSGCVKYSGVRKQFIVIGIRIRNRQN